jgi:hypothetical protein
MVNVTRAVLTDNGGPDVNLDSTLTVAIVAPPLSQTKGHGRGRRNIESEVQVRISINSLSMGKRLSALTTTEYVV